MMAVVIKAARRAVIPPGGRVVVRFSGLPGASLTKAWLSSSKPCTEASLPQARFFPVRKDPMLPAGTFKDKVVLVSGGGTGLGKAMAAKFFQLGASVAIASRRLNVLEETAREIEAGGPAGSKGGQRVLPLQCDIRDPEAVRSCVDACVAQLGLPNVVVNNAAGNFISPTERLSANAFKTIVDIVLVGTANLTLEVGKRMIKGNTGGVFLSITTHYTNEGSAFVVPSACAKSGVETMMKSLGVEWGRHGIRMNCIAPGPIHTEGAFSRLDPTGQFTDEVVKIVPTGRLGEPDELANLATYLCSDYASWATCETVIFDGGEFRSLAGEFNALRKVPEEMWDAMEKAIRSSNKKSKS